MMVVSVKTLYRSIRFTFVFVFLTVTDCRIISENEIDAKETLLFQDTSLEMQYDTPSPAAEIGEVGPIPTLLWTRVLGGTDGFSRYPQFHKMMRERNQGGASSSSASSPPPPPDRGAKPAIGSQSRWGSPPRASSFSNPQSSPFYTPASSPYSPSSSPYTSSTSNRFPSSSAPDRRFSRSKTSDWTPSGLNSPTSLSSPSSPTSSPNRFHASPSRYQPSPSSTFMKSPSFDKARSGSGSLGDSSPYGQQSSSPDVSPFANLGSFRKSPTGGVAGSPRKDGNESPYGGFGRPPYGSGSKSPPGKDASQFGSFKGGQAANSKPSPFPLPAAIGTTTKPHKCRPVRIKSDGTMEDVEHPELYRVVEK